MEQHPYLLALITLLLAPALLKGLDRIFARGDRHADNEKTWRAELRDDLNSCEERLKNITTERDKLILDLVAKEREINALLVERQLLEFQLLHPHKKILLIDGHITESPDKPT